MRTFGKRALILALGVATAQTGMMAQTASKPGPENSVAYQDNSGGGGVVVPTGGAVKELPKDLWEVWRGGFETFGAAETATLAGRNQEALELFKKSLSLFESIRSANPSWNKSVVDYRIGLCKRKISSIENKIGKVASTAPKPPASPVRDTAKDEEIASLRDSLAKAKSDMDRMQVEMDRARKSAAQVGGLLTEKESLEQKLAAALVQNEELKSKVQVQRDEADIEKRLVAERTRSEALARELKVLKDESDGLKSQRQEALGLKTQAEQGIKDALDKIAGMKTEISRLESVAKDSSSSSSELSAKLKGSETERERLASSLAAKDKECEELSVQLDKLRSGIDLTEASKQIQSESLVLRKERDELRAKAESLSGDLSKKYSELSAAKAEAAKLGDMLANITTQRNASDAELKALSDRYAMLDAEAKEKAKVYEASQKEIKGLKEELAIFASKIDSMKKDAGKQELQDMETSKRIADLEGRLNSASDAKSKLEASLAEMSAETDSLKQRLVKAAVASETATKLDADLKAMSDAKFKAELAVELAHKENEELKAHLATLAESSKGETSKYQERLAVLQRDNESLKSQLSKAMSASAEGGKLDARAKELESQIKEMSEAKDKVEDVVSALRKDNESLKSQLEKSAETSKESKSDFEGRLASLQRDNESLKAQVAKSAEESSEAKFKLEVKVASLQRDNESLKSQLSKAMSASAEGGKLDARAKELESQMKEMSEAKGKAENAALTLRKDNELLRGQLSKAQEGSTEQVSRLEAKLEDVEKDKSELERSCKQLEVGNRSLKESLELLKKESKGKGESEGEGKVKELETRLAELALNSEKYERLCRKLKSDKKELGDKVETSEREIKLLKEQLGEARKLGVGGGGTSEDYAAVAEKLIKKDEAISEMLKESENLKSEMKELKESLEASKDELRKAKRRAGDAVKEAGKSASEVERLKAEIKKLRDGSGAEAGGIKAASVPKSASAPNSTASIDKDRVCRDFIIKAKEAEFKKDWEGAVWHYWKAIEMDPEKPSCYMSLAKVYVLKGERENAAKAYKKALETGAAPDQSLERSLESGSKR